DPRSQLTRAGVAIGTPRYMAPEQAMGTDKIDQRADIYSLGVLLYEMLTGQPLFEGESDHSVMRKHVNTDAPDAAMALPDDTPGGVAEVLNRSLAKMPEDRYQTVGEMFSALEEAVGGAATPTPLRRLSSPGLPVPPAASLRRSVPPKQPSLSGNKRHSEGGHTGTEPDESLPSLSTLFRGPNGERRVPRVLVGLCVGAVVFGAGLALLRTNAPEPVPMQIHDLNAHAPVGEVAPVEEPRPSIQSPLRFDDDRSFPPPRNDRLPARSVEKQKRQGNATRRTERLPIERSRKGELRVTSKLEGQLSWAYIDLDGVRIGQTPIALKVDVGPHEVRLMRDGFKTITRQVDVESSDEPFKLTVELRR
ncbi:MAG: protein kinase domain-containing protein, partial [Myxococcaceae bacterium]